MRQSTIAVPYRFAASTRDVGARRGDVLLGSSLVVVLAAVSFASGGYRQDAWAAVALPLLWGCVLALLRPTPLRVSRSVLVAFGLFVAWIAWTTASLAWSLAPPGTALEVERGLAYVGFFGLLMLLVHERTGARMVIAAVAAAITVVVVGALAGYLLWPGAADPTQGRLLFEPLGYANALGGLAAIALPLLIAVALGPGGVAAVAAAAATVPVASALYLTQSRSAWLALACALGFWVARSVPRPGAIELAATTLFPASAVAAAVALRLVSPSLPDATHERRCVLFAVLALSSSAGAAVLCARLHRARRGRLEARPSVLGLGLACALGLGAVAAVLHGGVGDRPEYWRVAWRMFVAHPLRGTGAGTFAGEWQRLRTIPVSAKDAHSLYVETLGETGIAGLLLLVCALAVPLVVARQRRSPLEVAALGAYGAFLIHAGLEWDWEMPAVTLTALALATALLVLGSHDEVVWLRAFPRLAGVVACLVAAAFVGVSAVGHAYMTRAERLAAAGDSLAADAEARRAARALPWASEPLVVRGDLRLRGGDALAARAFYLRALRRDGRNWQIWLRLSAASSGRAAGYAGRRALQLDPGIAAGAP